AVARHRNLKLALLVKTLFAPLLRKSGCANDIAAPHGIQRNEDEVRNIREAHSSRDKNILDSLLHNNTLDHNNIGPDNNSADNRSPLGINSRTDIARLTRRR